MQNFIKKDTYILKVLKEFQSLDTDFSLQYCICFIYISQNPGLSLTELSKKSELKTPTVSRIVGALSNKRQCGEAFHLVQVNRCATSARRKEIQLTRRGQDLISRLNATHQEEHLITQ